MISRGAFYNFIIITILLGAISFYIIGIPKQQMEQGKWVAHTHEVLHKLSILSDKVSQARANQNAYLKINADEAHDNYKNVISEIQRTTDSIAELTKDNAAQQQRMAPLRQALADRFFGQSGEVAEDVEVIKHIEDISHAEQLLLKEREKSWHNALSKTRGLFLAATAVVYILILFAYRIARREATIRNRLLALESERHEAQRGIAERMTRVVEVQHDIIYQRLNLQGAMEVITNRTQQITDADGAVIEMLENKEMVYRAGSGSMEPFVGMRLPTEGSISGLCVASATPLRCDDSETDPRVNKEACRKVGVRSMIVVPLLHKDEVVGVLKVAAGSPGYFKPEHENTLQLMAGLLSVTLKDAAESQELKNRADTDGMTGVKNHRFFQEYLTQEYERSRRYDNSLSLIMCDVDHFKKFNDEFGHQAGDTVLKQVAELLKKHARPSDCVARYGGEEFAIILTQTPLSGAIAVAKRICDEIRGASWKQRAITMSMGVSGIENGAKTTIELIKQADKALYESKAAGRDRVSVYEVENVV